MAWYKCGGGTKTLTETALWTNSSPTSTFAEQTVTLSQSISNFDYIAIKHAAYKTKTTTDANIVTDMRSVADLLKGADNNSYTPHMFIGMRNAGTTYIRRIIYISNTQVKFSGAAKVGTSGVNNDAVIPMQIIGIKMP